jgi:CRISPR/Cas system-associated exonuclease Cas4 (RecB family)
VPTYNPAQQRVIELLGRSDIEPTFPADLAEGLRAELEAAVAPLADRLPPKLWVSKHGLSGVHGCEARHVAQEGDFAWSVATVRGQVAHKAIELAVNWRGEPVAGDLVDEAVARLADADVSASRFLGGLVEADRAQLRGEATDLVTKFQECFPPLRSAWRPVTESRVYVDLLEGAVVLSGKVDLTLGKHEPGRATKVIIDLKSGFPAPAHRDDLRFYALLETLRLGVPPRMLASYYLDAARAQPEAVTVPLLEAALARVIDGIHKMVSLANGREPTLVPGPSCRWCPIADTCVEGQSWLWSAEEGGGDP